MASDGARRPGERRTVGEEGEECFWKSKSAILRTEGFREIAGVSLSVEEKIPKSVDEVSAMVDLVRLMGPSGAWEPECAVDGGEVSRLKARRGIGRRIGMSVELMA